MAKATLGDLKERKNGEGKKFRSQRDLWKGGKETKVEERAGGGGRSGRGKGRKAEGRIGKEEREEEEDGEEGGFDEAI